MLFFLLFWVVRIKHVPSETNSWGEKIPESERERRETEREREERDRERERRERQREWRERQREWREREEREGERQRRERQKRDSDRERQRERQRESDRERDRDLHFSDNVLLLPLSACLELFFLTFGLSDEGKNRGELQDPGTCFRWPFLMGRREH